MTWREISYFVLDSLKTISDDSYITIDHILFLASKIRSAALQQRYADIKKEVPDSNYQTIDLELIEVPAISGEICEGGTYLRSKDKIPGILPVGNTSVYPKGYYQGHISFVSRDRMKHVGHNRWLKNAIYASIGPDGYLYLKSENPQFLHLKYIQMNAVFEDSDKASAFEEGEDDLDKRFPLEEGLTSTVIEMMVKYLSGVIYKPEDSINDAKDDLSDIMKFIRHNMKSNLQKQLEE